MTYPLGWTEPLRQALKKVSAYLSDIADRLDAIESSPGATSWDASGSDIHNTNSGNVGVGTTTPAAKLAVTGGFAVNRDGATTTYTAEVQSNSGGKAFQVLSAEGAANSRLSMVNVEGGTDAKAWALNAKSDGTLTVETLTDAESIQNLVVKFHRDGTVQISSLAGTGTRMVVVDANGTLSTQALP